MGFKENFKEKMNDRSYEERLIKNHIKRRERSEDRVNGYSYFLAALCVCVAVFFFVMCEFWLGMIFVGIAGLLVLLVYLSKKEEEKDSNKIKKNNP